MRHPKILLPLSWILATALAGCGDATTQAPQSSGGDDDPFRSIENKLTPLTNQCTFVASSGLMTVTLAANEVAVISKRATDSVIVQNGQPCTVSATSSSVKKIAITGSTGAETVVLDFTNGLFATGTSSASTTGITVDLAGGTDLLGIRGTTGADTITFGTPGIALNTDAFKDIALTAIENYTVYLGDGNDTFTAAGNSAVGVAGAFGTALTVYGGAGDDTFNEGAAATIGETIYGGPGTKDTLNYSLRVAALTVTVNAGANDGDGAATENDDIKDIDIITGGTLNDSITADTATAITLNGGDGNDTLIGSSAADTLNGDAGNDTLRGKDGNDSLNGGVGDDTFDEEAAATGEDAFNGGAGTDTVDYSARILAIKVTMDGAAADDGDVAGNEKDNVKADVENVKGSTQADDITGNESNNVITGGTGDDALKGGGGDDTFYEGAGATSSGNDTITGGAGVDTVDYSGRTAAVTALLDGTASSGVSGETDTLKDDVENLYGGTGNDALTGNGLANELVGNGGDDTLNGGAGDDILEGGAAGNAEDNILNCGAGGDIALNVGSGSAAVKNVDCEF
jgi:Ca2+-binding RTX toxin-like protein